MTKITETSDELLRVSKPSINGEVGIYAVMKKLIETCKEKVRVHFLITSVSFCKATTWNGNADNNGSDLSQNLVWFSQIKALTLSFDEVTWITGIPEYPGKLLKHFWYTIQKSCASLERYFLGLKWRQLEKDPGNCQECVHWCCNAEIGHAHSFVVFIYLFSVEGVSGGPWINDGFLWKHKVQIQVDCE